MSKRPPRDWVFPQRPVNTEGHSSLSDPQSSHLASPDHSASFPLDFGYVKFLYVFFFFLPISLISALISFLLCIFFFSFPF